MTELDRQIRATLQTLVALQGAKILQVEKEADARKADMQQKLDAMARRLNDQEAKLKMEAQA